MKFDMSRIQRAVKTLADRTGRTKASLMRMTAKGFVSAVIEITPPASPRASGSAAKKAGELTVQNDVLRLARPAFVIGKGGRAVLATRAQLLEAHQRARSGVKGGRVNPRNRIPLFMAMSDISAVIALLQKKVGFLAAGWNKAATELGVRVPSWIKRHGDAAGVVDVKLTATHFRLTVGNAVQFVDDVDGYEKRMEKAMTYEAGNLERQAGWLLKDSIKKAGFK